MRINPYLGKFISLEGIDGCGKSEQFGMLHDFLIKKSWLNFIFTKEPTGSEMGKQIYDILRGIHPTIKLTDLSEFDMQRKYFVDRRGHYQDLVLPALRAGVHVVSDRSLVSIAYGLKNMVDIDSFLQIQEAMFGHANFVIPLVVPDKVIIYDVDIDTAMERLNKKNRALDAFEQRSRLERTRANYLEIVNKIPNCVVVDGGLPVEEVFVETKKYVCSILKLTP